MSVNLRHRAVEMLEHWYHAKEAAVVKPAHPLVTVQEMHLVDGEGKTVRGSTKRTGRSMPPVRDMVWQARQVDAIMKHIGNVDHRWRRSMVLWVEHKTFKNAEKASKIKAHTLFREFNQGLAVLQSEIVRKGL